MSRMVTPFSLVFRGHSECLFFFETCHVTVCLPCEDQPPPDEAIEWSSIFKINFDWGVAVRDPLPLPCPGRQGCGGRTRRCCDGKDPPIGRSHRGGHTEGGGTGCGGWTPPETIPPGLSGTGRGAAQERDEQLHRVGLWLNGNEIGVSHMPPHQEPPTQEQRQK